VLTLFIDQCIGRQTATANTVQQQNYSNSKWKYSNWKWRWRFYCTNQFLNRHLQ